MFLGFLVQRIGDVGDTHEIDVFDHGGDDIRGKQQ